MAIEFKNIQELNATVDISNKVDPGWKVNSDASRAVALFYEQWSVYLSPQLHMIHTVFGSLLGYISKIIYFISYAVEELFFSLFKLFGFVDFIGNKNTFIGGMYFWFQVIGSLIFILLLVIRVVSSFFGNRVRYQFVVNHLLLVTAVTAFLPFATKELIRITIPTVQNVSTFDKGASLSLQPFKDNVVDLTVLIANSWNVDKLGYEEDTGYVNITKAKVDSFNNITDKNIYSVNFGASFGAADKDVLEYYIDESDGDKSSAFYGISDILSSKLSANTNDVVKIDKGSAAVKELSTVYPLYSVNWVGLYIQQIVIIALLFWMAVMFVSSIYNIVIHTMIAPIVGYSSVDDSTKFKELLNTIIGGYAGAVFQVILLRVAMEFMTNYKQISLSGIPGMDSDSLGAGLSFWQNFLLSILIYIGMYFVVMNGNRMVDRWLGISTRNFAGMMVGGHAVRKGVQATSGAIGAGIGTALSAGKGLGKLVKKGYDIARDKDGDGLNSVGPKNQGDSALEKSETFDDLFNDQQQGGGLPQSTSTSSQSSGVPQ
ncbi:TPA: pLS20_p028 family conjugation system transmembrane protein, partial [Streptococcus suis]